MALAALTIDRLHLDVRIPSARPEWRALAPQFAHLARERLAPACARHPVLPQGEPGVYLIERIELELACDGRALTDHAFVDQLAQAITRKLHDTLAHAGPGTAVLRFASEAAFLATFLADLLRGQAGDRWYYRCFAPLRALPTGLVATQLLIEDNLRGHEALLALAQSGTLERLLVELSDDQARALLDHCLLPWGQVEPPIGGTGLLWVQALTNLLQARASGELARWAGARAGLWLYLTLVGARPELGPDTQLAGFVAGLLQLHQALAAHPQRALVLAALGAGDARAALRLLAAHVPAHATALLTGLLRVAAPPAAATLLGLLVAQLPSPTASSPTPPLPDAGLQRLAHELRAAVPALADAPRLAAFLTLLAADDLAAAVEWLRRQVPTQQASIDRSAARLRELRQAYDPARLAGLLEAALQAPAAQPAPPGETAGTLFGGVFLLAPAIERLGLAEWLAGCPYPPPCDQPAEKAGLLLFLLGLQALGARWAQQGLHDNGLAWLAGLDRPPAREALQAYAEQVPPDRHRSFRAELSRHLHARGLAARPTPAALAHELGAERLRALRLARGPQRILANERLDRALGLATGALLREFARSLRGFADSSPDYVRRNLLFGPARIERDAQRLHVHLEHCPLAVVLRMAGFEREQPALAWLGGRRLAYTFG